MCKDWSEIKAELDSTPDLQKSVLLGNGFSISYATDKNNEQEIFNSQKLISEIHAELNDEISGINNVEDYISLIHRKFISKQFDKIKLHLDAYPNADKKAEYCNFLKLFKEIYTLNYDPILYWLLLDCLPTHGGDFKTTDGFNPWSKDKYTNGISRVYYLHGAFHIFKDEKSIKKAKGSKGNSMLENIRKEWDNDKKSHLILEGDWINKKMKLTNSEYSSYFKHCFDYFHTIRDILVVHGVSFSDNDQHIIDAINNNTALSKIYIGCHSEDDLKNFQEKFQNNNRVEYFCSIPMFK